MLRLARSHPLRPRPGYESLLVDSRISNRLSLQLLRLHASLSKLPPREIC
jgi:hypothetical protein